MNGRRAAIPGVTLTTVTPNEYVREVLPETQPLWGGTRDFAEAYRLFRGRDPQIDALLEGRGLAA